MEDRRQRELKLMFNLKVATMADMAQEAFQLQRTRTTASPRSVPELFNNIARLADEPGDEAWFSSSKNQFFEVPRARTHQSIPVGRAFYRIKSAMPCMNSPTIQEVDAALSNLMTVNSMHQSKQAPDPLQPSKEAQCSAQTLQQLPADPVQQADDEQPADPLQPSNGDEQLAGHFEPCSEGTPTEADNNNSIAMPIPAVQVCPSTPLPPEPTPGIAELFTTPEQAILPQPPLPPGKRGRRLKKSPVQLSGLRRSKRRACSRIKHLPAEQRAAHVLCRRLGYIKDDLTPAELAIQEFVATFKGPMPQFIVAGLTSMLRLDDEDICNATEALIRLGGPEVADGLPEVSNNV
ncbi:unnamed protein product [Urochloa humidicola]